MLSALHNTFARFPASTFALALPDARPQRKGPPGARFRVFATTTAELAQMRAVLGEQYTARDYATLGEPTATPAAKRWIEYRRVRIPKRGSRLYEKLTRQYAGCPYFILRSASTRQPINIPVAVTEAAATPEGTPDSYGLASSTRPFALPDF
jgi:hypothetical protein